MLLVWCYGYGGGLCCVGLGVVNYRAVFCWDVCLLSVMRVCVLLVYCIVGVCGCA